MSDPLESIESTLSKLYGASADDSRVLIKFEFEGRKHSLLERRPLRLERLRRLLDEHCQCSVSMLYRGEPLLPIMDQRSLDQALSLVDRVCPGRLPLLLVSEGRRRPSEASGESSPLDPAKVGEGIFIPDPPGDELSSVSGSDPDLSRPPRSASNTLPRSAPHTPVSPKPRGNTFPGRVRVPENRGSRESVCSSPGLEAPSGWMTAVRSPRTPKNWKQGRALGTGAFGTVYLCYDADSGREFAVKMVPLTTSAKKEVEALECEIQLLRNLKHDRIVQYIGCEQKDTALCIFLEYMSGGSVRDELQRYGPLTEAVARRYAKQVLEGLCFLHTKHIVHRDVKGANVLRDAHANVKLSDFGSAKRLQSVAEKTGQVASAVGTPFWMAPEVIQGSNYGRRADVWSFGCLLVEMLTGKPPHADLEPFQALFKIATSTETGYVLSDSVSDAAKDILSLALTRDGQNRPHADALLSHRFVVDQWTT